MKSTKFSDTAAAALRSAGFSNVSLLRTSPESAAFGDSEVVFNIDGFVLRFTRDRGEEFVDLASARTPADFHQVYDVEQALGWMPVDASPARLGPAPLTEVLSRLREHFNELKEAFSADRDSKTQARIRQVTREREQAFLRKLSQPQR